MTRSLLARCALGFLLAAPQCAQAADVPVKLVMDWAFEGPQSIWSLPVQNGCFKQHGLDVTVDRGFGSGDAISKVAAGAYDIGVADFASIISFNARNPDKRLLATFVVSDRSPTSVTVLKKSGIEKPKDLEGKRIADPQGEASRVLFPAFAKKNGIDPAKITWVTVEPNLRQATLVQGQADAVAGHMFTVFMGLRALGVKDEDMRVMLYADFGVNLFGNTLIAKPQWLATHREEMRSLIGCAVAAIKQSIADPKGAVDSLKKFNSMVDDKTELDRLDFSNKMAIMTPHVMEKGLSAVEDARLDYVLTEVSAAMEIAKPAAGDTWTPDYLPASETLMLGK
jgi:NitT/TauT family transport system substrate-binding protein